MKRKSLFNFLPAKFAALLAPLMAAWPLASQAANNTWSVGAGTGNWDTTTANWTLPTVWNNTLGDTAVFGGTAGTVTLTTGISAGGLTFNTNGYTVTGNTMSVNNGSIILLNGVGVNATINSAIAGPGTGDPNFTGNFTISGSGGGGQVATLGGTNTYVGGMTINNGGIASIAAVAALGNGQSDVVLNNGTLRGTGATQIDFNTGRTISFGAGGGTIDNNQKFLLQGANNLAGNGTLSKTGAGILQVNRGNADFTGNIVLNAGTIEFQNRLAFGSGVGQTITVNGGELAISTHLAGQNRWTGSNMISHAVIYNGGILGVDNGPGNGYAGPITIGATPTQLDLGLRNFYAVTTPIHMTISGNITGGAKDLNILKSTTGGQQHFLSLSGNNSGITGTIKSGGVTGVGADIIVEALSGDSNLPGANTNAVTLNGGTLRFAYTPAAPAGVATAGWNATYYNNGSSTLLSGIQTPGVSGNNQGQVTNFMIPAVITRTEQRISGINNTGGTVHNVPLPTNVFSVVNDSATWTGTLNIANGGDYSFFTGADDGIQVYIEGKRIIDNDFGHGFPGPIGGAAANTTTSQHVANGLNLTAGEHSIVVKFSQGTGGAGFMVDYSGPDTAGIRARLQGSTTMGVDTRTAGGISSGRNITIANAAAGTIDATNDLNYTGNITFTGGASTLNFTSNLRNTTTVNNGFAIPGGAVTTLNSQTANTTFKGVISEAAANGQTTFGGFGTTRLENTNTFTGASIFNGATFVPGPFTLSYAGLDLGAAGGNSISGTGLTVNSGNVRILADEQIANAGALSLQGISQAVNPSQQTASVDLGTFTETVTSFTLNGGTLLGSGTGLTLSTSAVNSFGLGATDQLKVTGTNTITRGTLAIPLHGTAGLNWNNNGNALGLAAINDYTGLTTVTGGALVLNGAGTLGVTGIFGSGNETTVAAGVGNSASLQLVNGANALDDINLIGNGTGGDGAIRSIFVNIIPGGVTGTLPAFGANNTNTVSGAINLTGATNIQADGMTILNLNGAVGATNQNLTLQGGGQINLGSTLNIGTGSFTVNSAQNSLAGAATIGALNSNAPGWTSFNGAVTSGAVTVAAGSGTTVFNNTLNTGGAALSVNSNTTFSGVATTGGGNITITGGDTTFNASPVTGAGTITRTGTGGLIFGLDLATDPALLALATASTNRVVLNGAQTFGAASIPASGRWEFGGATSVPGTLTVSGTAATNYAMNQAFLGNVAPASTGNIALGVSSGNNLDFATPGLNTSLGAIRPASYTGTITPNAATYRLGAGGITRTGNGLLSGVNFLNVRTPLTGSNALTVSQGGVDLSEDSQTFTGAITIDGTGVLKIRGNDNLGNVANVVTLTNGGTLAFANPAPGQLGQGITFTPGRSVVVGTGGGMIDVAWNSNAVLGGVNALTGSGTLTKTGLGEFQLGSANNFAGNIVMATNGGVFFLKGNSELTTGGNPTYTINPGSRLDVNRNGGIGPIPNGAATRNSLPNGADIVLQGGNLNYGAPNSAGNFLELVRILNLGVGQSTLTVDKAGQGSIFQTTNALGYAAGNTNQKASILRLVAATGTLGFAADNPRVQFNMTSLPADATFGGGNVINGGTFNFVQYDTTLASYGDYGTTGYDAYAGTAVANLVSGSVNNLTADVTLGSGGGTAGALRLSGAANRQVLFNATTPGTLFIERGGVLSENLNNPRTIGATGLRGTLTAGPATANAIPRSLYLMQNQNTLTVNSVIVDNNAQPVSVVKGLDGQVTLTGTNTYTGGTYALRGTLEAGAASALGQGDAFVKNARLNLAAAGAIGGGTARTIFATDNAEVLLTGTGVNYNGTSDRFDIAGGSILLGPNTSNGNVALNSITRVALFSGVGQAILAPDAIIGHQAFPAGQGGIGSNTIKFGTFATAADLYYGLSGNPNNNQFSVTVGSGTAWKGISTDRANRTFQAGTIYANSDFFLQGLTRDGGVARLQIGGGGIGAGNSVNILNTTANPINAYLVGDILMDDDVGMQISPNITFELTPNSFLTAARPNQFGTGANIAAGLHIQSGATLDLGFAAGGGSPWSADDSAAGPLNTPVVVDGGGRIISNDTGGLGAGAPITLRSGAILDMAHANALIGANGGRITWDAGAVARIQADNIFWLNSRVGQNATFEIFNGNRQLTSQVDFTQARDNNFASNPYAPMITPQDLIIDGGVITNDAGSRSVTRGTVSGQIVVGASVATFAGSSNTILTMDDDIRVPAGTTLTIGSATPIAGQTKVGNGVLGVANGGAAGAVALNASNSNIIEGTVNILDGAQLRFTGVNVWPDTASLNLAVASSAFPASTELIPTGSSLFLANAQPEVIGGLTGNGTILSNQANATGVLAVGNGGVNSTFNGVFASSGGQQPSLSKIGSGTLTLTGVNTSTGTLAVQAGDVVISGTGRSDFNQSYLTGGRLILDNSAAAGGAADNRLGGKDVLPWGGELLLKGHGTTAVTETAGILRIGNTAGGVSGHQIAGHGYVSVDPGAAQTNLFFNTVANSFISGGQTVVFRGPGMGGTPGTTAIDGSVTAAAASNGLIRASTNTNLWTTLGNSSGNPNSIGGVINGGSQIIGSIGSWVAPVRGDILGDTSLSGTGTRFVTSDTFAAGYRQLATSEQATSVWANTAFARNTSLSGSHAVGGGLTTVQTLEMTGATVTVGSTIPLTANPSRFNVNTGGILTQAGTASSITAPVLGNFGAQATMYFWNHGDLTVNSRMHAVNGLTKNGAGTLTLGPDALASFTSGAQGHTINDGKVAITGTGNNPLFINYPTGGSFFFSGQRVNVNKTGVLDLGGRNQIIGSLFSNDGLWSSVNTESAGDGGTITSNNPAVLTQHGGSQFGGHFAGAITLNHTGSNGTGDLILTGSHTHTGATISRVGFISLRDNGTMLNTSSVELNHANFELTNTGNVQSGDRLADSIPVNLRGGLFQYIGGRQASAETIGTATLVLGNNTFTVGAGQSTSAALTVTDLARSQGATFVAQATSGGGPNTTGGGILGFPVTNVTNPRLILTKVNGAAPTLNDGLLGGWATDGSNFLTYDATYGVQIFGQPQNGTPKYSGNALWAATAADNINLNAFGGANHTADYTTGDKTINSLRFQGTATVSLGGKLTVDTGGVLVNNVAANLDGGSITSGGTELFFTVSGNTASVQSAIVNNGGAVHVVKSGGGTLALLGDNTNTGNLYANGGTVVLNNLNGGTAVNGNVFIAGATVTAQRSGQLASGGTITVNGNGSYNYAFPVAGGTDTVSKVILNNIGANAQTSFGGGSTNTSAITFTDPTPIVAVTDNIAQPTALSNAIGFAHFAPSSGTTSTIDVTGSAPLGLVMNANIGTIPSGGIIKTGDGLMSLGGTGTTFGNPVAPNTTVLTLSAGGVRVDQNAAIGPVNAVTVVNANTYLLGGNNTTGITGSIKLNGGLLGVTSNNTVIAGNIEAAAASTIRAFEYYDYAANRAITHTGVLSGSADLTLEGSPLTGVNGSPFVLGNTANTYSGNWLVKPNAQLRVSAGALTGNTLGTSTVRLQGGMLDLRDNNANTFNNNVILEASSRINVDRATLNANNQLTIGTLTAQNDSVLTVTNANGYTLGVSQLAGSATLTKAGQVQMNINGYAGGYNGSFGIAGASGIAASGAGTQHTYNTTSFDNVTFAPAVNTFTNFTNSGFYITPASKTISAQTFEVAANSGNLPGALGVRDTTTLTVDTFTNNGQIGPVNASATITADAFNGSGHYLGLGTAQMTLAGSISGGSLKIAGDNIVQLNGSSHALAGAEVQSGTLKISASIPVATTGAIRVFGSAADTTLKQGAITATLDLAAGSGGITHAGDITNNGLVKVSSGTATVSGIIGGTGTQYVPGLREGMVQAAVNPFDPSASRTVNSGNFGIRLEPRMAQTNAVTQNAVTGWTDNQMFVYTGWIKDTDGVFSFAENIDDNVLVSIDGVNRLVGNGPGNPWQTVTSSALSAGQAGTTLVAGGNTAAAGDITNNFGAGVTLPGYGSGWHRVEIRVANGNGGAGPVAANGFGANYGLGFSPDGTLALDGGAYIKPIDDGTGNLFVTEVGGKGSVTLETGTQLSAAALQQIKTITFNDNGGGAILNLTGITGLSASSDAEAITVAGTASSPTANLNAATGHTMTAGVLNLNSGGTFRLNPTVGNTGTLNLTGIGTGAGSVEVGAGTLALFNGSAVADSVAVSIADVAGATLVLNNSETIGSLAGGGATGGAVNLGSSVLTTGGNNGTTTFAGAISGGASSGLVKEGSGVLTLTGTSTYTGPTTINAGTLNIAEGASIASSSLLTVNNSGAVTGTGTTGAVLLGEGSEIRPGTSPGILSTGNITTTGGVLGTGIYMEIGGLTAGTQHDQIQTTGTMTLNGGTLVVSLINAFVPTKNDVFWIWLNDSTDVIGGTPGWLTNLPDGTVFPVTETASTDDAWQIHYNVDGDGSGAANDIRLTYIPEPTSAGLLLGFLSFLGLRRRRR